MVRLRFERQWTRRVAVVPEARDAACFCFVRVDRKRFVVASARMGDVTGAAAYAAPTRGSARLPLLRRARRWRAAALRVYCRHLRVRRHVERAQFEDAQAAGRGVGRIQLVDAEFGTMGVAGEIDQQVAQQAVDQSWRERFLAGLLALRHLPERGFEFVEIVVARRLAGGADELPGEQGMCRLVVRACGDCRRVPWVNLH